MTKWGSYCSYSHCPRMNTFTSLLKGNVPSSLRKRYSSLASLYTGLLSHTASGPQASDWNNFHQQCHFSAKILDCVCRPLVTVVNDVMVHEVLQEADGGGSVRSLLVAHDPVDQLLRHEAVGVRSQMVAPVLDQLPVMKPQPWG